MNNVYEAKVLWAQIDANMHLRHSAYADFAAQARISLLEGLGMNDKVFRHYKIGPILFREELNYLREVGMSEEIKIITELTKSRADGSRWSIRHQMYRHDGVEAAIINVEGAWIDMEKRKLTTLPQELVLRFMSLPKSDDYEESAPSVNNN